MVIVGFGFIYLGIQIYFGTQFSCIYLALIHNYHTELKVINDGLLAYAQSMFDS